MTVSNADELSDCCRNRVSCSLGAPQKLQQAPSSNRSHPRRNGRGKPNRPTIWALTNTLLSADQKRRKEWEKAEVLYLQILALIYAINGGDEWRNDETM